jgi:hypothetical protein
MFLTWEIHSSNPSWIQASLIKEFHASPQTICVDSILQKAEMDHSKFIIHKYPTVSYFKIHNFSASDTMIK